MEFVFNKEGENKLLNRTELEFVINYEGATPSRKEILGKLCALRNVPVENCVIDSLKSEFGKQEILAKARIYADAEMLKATELDYLVKRNSPEVKAEEEA
ncbi:30S ribosomal protein S24e [Methanoplanus endosymbiosus]|uniref:Small ribosomal subunit protein eS24 n=1 Tax=Methanoplanus endosymbiosus TaxID=33865 RepID=A0A9E7TMD6_9EURY|nr:30S ribosomal protein S24e [Methanoplanus endosymbiosus]UUX93166.1 30S ribosomal protein S24e [Methanoplanus endosymbiosus]